MKVYVNKITGLVAQGRDFWALSEEVVKQQYGFELLKAPRSGKRLKAENYSIYRRYIPDINEWQFLVVSRQAKKKVKNLSITDWELVKPAHGPILEHVKYVE